MEKLSNIIHERTINPTRLILLCLVILCWGKSTFAEKKLHGTPMHKVELTQKGYIQVRNYPIIIDEIIHNSIHICMFFVFF